MADTRSSAEFIPQDNPEYAIPVQQGDVQHLCVFRTPDGQGICAWVDQTANEFRCAVVPVFEDCFFDDVVPPGDVRTVWDGAALGRDIWVGSISVVGSMLLAFISSTASNNGKVECYLADDIENPVVWTLRSTMRDHTSPGAAGPFSVQQAGTLTVLDTGRWLLPMHGWNTFAGTALEDTVALYTTDDLGVTWTLNINFRKGALFGGTAGPQSTTAAQNPVSGDWLFGSHVGSTTQWRVWDSPDGFTTINSSADINGAIDPWFFMNDTQVLYAARINTNDLQLFIVDDPTDVSTWTDLNMRGLVLDVITQGEGIQMIPIWSPDGSSFLGMVYTGRDRVVYNPACRNVHPDPLFIPWKDSYSNFDLEEDEEGNFRLTVDSIRIVQAQEFDNWKTVERWAQGWHDLTESEDSCRLWIEWKDYLNTYDHTTAVTHDVADHNFENMKTLERWGYRILAGECGCLCSGSSPPADKCILTIPFKDHLRPLVGSPGPWEVRMAATQSFDGWKTIERWASRYASGECGCSTG